MFTIGEEIIFTDDFGHNLRVKIYHIKQAQTGIEYHCQDGRSNCFKVDQNMVLIDESKKLNAPVKSIKTKKQHVKNRPVKDVKIVANEKDVSIDESETIKE
jgi:hypothetical protein